jgi:predicted AAA+ superfamily ATPase
LEGCIPNIDLPNEQAESTPDVKVSRKNFMIPRPKYLTQIATLLESHPVVAILGPRQVGKTTLSRQFIQQ